MADSIVNYDDKLIGKTSPDFNRILSSKERKILEDIESDKYGIDEYRGEQDFLYDRRNGENNSQSSYSKNKKKRQQKGKQNEDPLKKEYYYVQKHLDTQDNLLAEAVIVAGKAYFAVAKADSAKQNEISISLQESISLEDTKELRPSELISYMNRPYAFKSTHEFESFIERAKKETLDSLYNKVKSIWKKYIDANNFHIAICAADTIFSYYQDRLGLTHYLFFVGGNNSGKSNNLNVIHMLAYRNFMSTDMTPANIYTFLGSMQEGQGTLCMDEADSIDNVSGLMRILKNGYTTGFPVARIDTTYGRKQQRFYTYGFKAFSAERLPNDIAAKGFIQRIVSLHCTYGDPEYDISEVLNPAGEDEYQKLLEEFQEVRNTLLMHKMLHFFDKIPDIEVNISGREKQLFKPLLRLFQNANDTLGELKPVISKYISTRRDIEANSLHAYLYMLITELIRTQKTTELGSELIWNTIKETLQGNEVHNKPQSYDSTDYGIISQKEIVQIYKEVFGATKSKHHGSARKLVFNLERLNRLGKMYDLSTDIEITIGKDWRTHGTHRTLSVGLDSIIQNQSDANDNDSRNESNHIRNHNDPISINKDNNIIESQLSFHSDSNNEEEEDISLKTQEQTDTSIDTNNVSQASQASYTSIQKGDALQANNNHVSQLSHILSLEQTPSLEKETVATTTSPIVDISQNIYRLGHSDTWSCKYCKLKGDKWFMGQHMCKGQSK